MSLIHSPTVRRPPAQGRAALAVFLLLALIAAPIAQGGEATLEVIELKHRPAAEVLPIIQPFLAGDDVIRAHGFQLILRTSPQRLEQVREILARVDVAPRRLLIAVRQALDQGGTRREAGADVELSNRGSAVRGRVHATDTREAGGAAQQIQVLEGNPALIQFGQSMPVGERTVTITAAGAHVQDTVRYKDVTTGFYVLPRVAGDEVILHIGTHRDTLSREHGGTINVQRAETTVRGPLGAWIGLGGTVEHLQRQGAGTVYRTRERTEQQGRIQIKVELID